ncbi:MAG TPA: amino acid adenylation domain-containing protein [Pyrinomonadaceae bacterium]|nr:amino acid adenylation domain-containing protein [Pyrinomonadaceae bacterium]
MSKDQIEDIYPLSPMQEGMIFHTLLAPESRVYFQQESYSLHGDLDVAALKQAWQQVIDRHSILRTSFVWERRDKPLQIVYRRIELPWQQKDWRGLTPSEQQDQLKSFLHAGQQSGFDLSKTPLIRLTLIQMGERQYELIWEFHHTIMDKLSAALLFKEVFACYKSCKNGERVQLEQPRPFRDYITWLQRQDRSAAEEFWRKTLKGITAPTPFRVDHPVDGKEETYDKQTISLSQTTTAGLQSLAQRHQLTLNTIIQGAWGLLLSRYSGEESVVFGTTVSGRPMDLVGAESMIGLFINTLPVRVDVSPGNKVINWLKSLQSQLVEARQYVYSPLVDVHACSEVPRGTPLFESTVVFESMLPTSGSHDHGKDFEIRNGAVYEWSHFPLAAVVWPTPELTIDLWYDCRRFDLDTITRMLGHWQTLLEGIAAGAEQRLSELSLLTSKENQRLIFDWNQTYVEYAERDLCLHELFEQQAERRSEAVAVVCEGRELTYRELNERADQLSLYLQTLGVGPEVLVGICVERSLEMVVGLLAILKAGGAYVPLDPSYPAERLRFMLADAGAPVLLTQQRLLSLLPAHDATVVCLDADWETIAQLCPPPAAPPVATTENLAYMIYTSGSTGLPKGAMTTHSAIVNRLLWMQQAYELNKSDRVLQKTPLSFDVSGWELFWPLITGARMVLARPEGHKDSSYLIDLIDEQQITTLHFVPSMLQAFLEDRGVERCTSLRRVICSGEALTVNLQERFFERLGGAELHNLYGPTEAAIDVTFWRCERDDRRSSVPIGRPIANTQLYILDERLELVPVGATGELYLGGVGLARGYHGRPELTAEKFIPDAMSGRSGSRWYRTGDVVRYGEEGEVEYLGRVDQQVKVRGNRIELGEIEAVLVSHPGIQEAVVTIHEHAEGDVRLRAYLVPDQEQAFPVRQLLRFEKEGLLAGRSRLELPNGREIVCLANKEEARFLYKEIFEEHCYFRSGISLKHGACVFDVGANIGMFTLFAGTRCRDVTVYAFEPVPAIFEVLKLNAALSGLNVKLFDCGLSREAATEVFTYYPQFPGSSGRFGDPVRDREVLKSGVLNMLRDDSETEGFSSEELEAIIGERVSERLIDEQITCQLRTISEVISENSIERIDLLKIDAEKSESDVLAGISEDDWLKIDQIVMEVHDLDGRLDQIRRLLESHGYEVNVEQEAWCEGTELYNLYARRSGLERAAGLSDNASQAWSSQNALLADVRRLLEEQLPEFMMPSAFVMLDALPLTPSGKIDRKALPRPDRARPQRETAFVAPRTPLEQDLVNIWRELLGIEQIGIHDKFFELGGHSLLLTRLASRIHRTFGVEVPLRVLFNTPTVVDMTTAIAARQVEHEDQTEAHNLLEELKKLSPEEVKALLEAEEDLIEV